MNRALIHTLVGAAAVAVACVEPPVSVPAAARTTASLTAEQVRLDVASTFGEMVLKGERFEMFSDENHVILSGNATATLLGDAPFHAVADRIDMNLSDQRVSLSGHVKSSFSVPNHRNDKDPQ